MHRYRTASTSALILISLALFGTLARGATPSTCKIDGVPRIKQLHNYCGPATIASILQFYGEAATQEEVGKVVYDKSIRATHGADMLLYARNAGYSAYSWNSNLADAKAKLAAGIPLLVLQQNSNTDRSGHYRVLTGYDDAAAKFHVVDPYYDEITELSYSQCEKWWKPMGYWTMMIVPKDRDRFARELNDRNPVVHMDLSSAMYRKGDYAEALKEAKLALSLEPRNSFALSMVSKINKAMTTHTGAGKK